jgi:hypothetical protein
MAFLDVTGRQIKEAMIANKITKVDYHQCPHCDWRLHFLRKGNRLFFDSGCKCTRKASLLRRENWDALAKWINLESNQQAKARLLQSVGFGVKRGGSFKVYEDYMPFAEDLKILCERHGVGIVGISQNDDCYGEILFFDLTDPDHKEPGGYMECMTFEVEPLNVWSKATLEYGFLNRCQRALKLKRN